MAGEIEDAQHFLQEGRAEDALEALLEAWRRRRAPAIATVVEDLSLRVASSRPAIAGRTMKARDKLWFEAAAEQDAADLGRLLPNLLEGNSVRARERLDALALRPPDPRIGHCLVGALEKVPFPGVATRPFWSLVFKTLPMHADPAIRQRLERVRGTFNPKTYSETAATMFDNGVRRALRGIDRLTDEAPAALSTDEKRRLVGIQDEVRVLPLGTRDAEPEEDFLNGIASEPDDDGLRQVYADWLLERGDERGELILLQFQRLEGGLTKAQATRERSLLHNNRRDWLGPLADVLKLRSVVFERGFLERCALKSGSGLANRLQGVVGDRHWATVREIDEAQAGSKELFLHPVMRSLKTLRKADLFQVQTLFNDATSRDLETLTAASSVEMTRQMLTLKTLREIGASESLPKLRHLSFGDGGDFFSHKNLPIAESFRRFWPGPVSRQLESLGSLTAGKEIGAWWRELEEHAGDFNGKLRLIIPGLELEWARESDGRWSSLRVDFKEIKPFFGKPAAPKHLARWLNEIDKDALTRLEIHGPAMKVRPLEKFAERQERLQEVILPESLKGGGLFAWFRGL